MEGRGGRRGLRICVDGVDPVRNPLAEARSPFMADNATKLKTR